LRTSDLRLTILKIVKEKEIYGYDIQKKLASEGTNIEIGRLYRVLGKMLQDGLLEVRWEKSSLGPQKKLYKLGKGGKEELDQVFMNAIIAVHRAYGEYLLSLPPEKDVFQAFSEAIVQGKTGKCNFALVAEASSPMYHRLLSGIRTKLPDSRIFVVKPKLTSLKIELEDTTIVEGNLVNVPLRDKFVDLLLATNMPTNENMENASREWRRVIKDSGRVAFLSPIVLFGRDKDPLTIGDFMEQWEHQIYENREPGEGEILLNTLRENFQKITEKNIVHMRLILAE
jgi:PadR family transcriptional regulator PadR